MRNEPCNNRFTSTARRHRFLARALYPGESISSWLDRNVGFWGVGRRDLLLQMGCDSPDCDSPTAITINELAKASGNTPKDIAFHAIGDATQCIPMAQRHAYCALCIQEDLSQGRMPYFRTDWARFFLTHCPIHHCPLFMWKATRLHGTRSFPHEWFLGERGLSAQTPRWFVDDVAVASRFRSQSLPISNSSRELWLALVGFESQLLREGVGNPQAHGDRRTHPSLQREAIGTCLMMLRSADGDVASTPAAALRFDYEDHDHISFTLRRFQGRTPATDWANMRHGLANLPCRRAVIALVAHTLCRLAVPLVFPNGETLPRPGGHTWTDQLESFVGEGGRPRTVWRRTIPNYKRLFPLAQA